MDVNSTTNYTTALPLTVFQRYNNVETQILEKFRPDIVAITTFLPPVWWFIGIIGNIASLLVWLQPKMRHSSGYYLAALATVDLCFLPLSMVYEINFTYRYIIVDKTIVCEWFAIFYMSFQYMSPVLVLAFTVERYLSVCHPFRMVNFNQSNSKVTLIVIPLLIFGCFGLNAIQGWFWTITDDKICDLRGDSAHIWTIWTWITEMLVFAAVPLAVLVLNILVITEVKHISKLERKNMRTNSIDKRSTTLMLLGVSFYQIFTVLPVTIVYALHYNYKVDESALYLTDEEIANNSDWQGWINYMAARILIQHICMSHYAANFFIYLLTGKIFRKQLYELIVVFCCKKPYSFARRTVHTHTTRMSTHRDSIAKSKTASLPRQPDICNNDTELGNKNSMYSLADLEETSVATSGISYHRHAPVRHNSLKVRLMTCQEESDNDLSDQESNQPPLFPNSDVDVQAGIPMLTKNAADEEKVSEN